MELQEFVQRNHSVERVLDDAWTLASRTQRTKQTGTVSTATILFTLCEPARMLSLPESITMRYLHEAMEGRWIRLSAQRALYVGHGEHHESRSSEFGTLSDMSRRVVRHARVLAHDAGSKRLRLRYLLRALLTQPGKPEEISAHAVLRELGLDPVRMACNFAVA